MPFSGLAPIASVTGAVPLVAVLPSASCTAPGCVPNAAPAVELRGLVGTAGLDAGPTVMVNLAHHGCRTAEVGTDDCRVSRAKGGPNGAPPVAGLCALHGNIAPSNAITKMALGTQFRQGGARRNRLGRQPATTRACPAIGALTRHSSLQAPNGANRCSTRSTVGIGWRPRTARSGLSRPAVIPGGRHRS